MNFLQHIFHRKIASAIAISTLVVSCASSPTIRHDTSEDTWSPNGKYGITVPVYHLDDEPKKPDGNARDEEVNKVVNLKTGRDVVVIEQYMPGYDRSLNHHGTGGARWSFDSSLLLWEVGGKWFDDSLVLIKIEDDKAQWQLDLMKAGQQAIFERTKKAAPQEYAAFRKQVMDSDAAYKAKYPGERVHSAYPEGFAVDVRRAGNENKPLALPLKIHVDLTSNLKGISDIVTISSYLDAVVTEDGKLTVKDFKLGFRPLRRGDDRPSWQ
jgi:hypothetical protein